MLLFQTYEFPRDCARRAFSEHGGLSPSTRVLVTWFRQRVAVTLQRAQSRAIHARTAHLEASSSLVSTIPLCAIISVGDLMTIDSHENVNSIPLFVDFYEMSNSRCIRISIYQTSVEAPNQRHTNHNLITITIGLVGLLCLRLYETRVGTIRYDTGRIEFPILVESCFMACHSWQPCGSGGHGWGSVC